MMMMMAKIGGKCAFMATGDQYSTFTCDAGFLNTFVDIVFHKCDI